MQPLFTLDISIPTSWQIHQGSFFKQIKNYYVELWTAHFVLMSMLILTAQQTDRGFALQQVLPQLQTFSSLNSAAVLTATFNTTFPAWNIPKEKVHMVLKDYGPNHMHM